MTPDEIKELIKELADSFLEEDTTTVQFIQTGRSLSYLIIPQNVTDAGLVIGKGGVRIKAIKEYIRLLGYAWDLFIEVNVKDLRA